MDFKQRVEQAFNRLTKKDGTPTKSEFQVINVLIGEGNEKINACIAPQFAKQGYPVTEYGEKGKNSTEEENKKTCYNST